MKIKNHVISLKLYTNCLNLQLYNDDMNHILCYPCYWTLFPCGIIFSAWKLSIIILHLILKVNKKPHRIIYNQVETSQSPCNQ